MKFRVLKNGSYAHWCQGCGRGHVIGSSWSFNGDIQKPTINPSIRIFTPAHTDPEDGIHYPEKTYCHYFIKGGAIEYCSDSPHKFSGQTLPLEDGPENYGWPE